jgi:hypothetical protein
MYRQDEFTDDASKKQLVRKERALLFKEFDAIAIKHLSTSTEIPTEWATYGQALRDLTNLECINNIDDDFFEITWPTKPE